MSQIPTVVIDGVPDPLPEGLVVLDVREPVEWDYGHIEGAVHIPLTEIPSRVEELPVDQQLLVVCKVGGRSAQATSFLREKGFDAVNLAGGMIDWAEAGRPMVGDGDGDPLVV